MTHATITTSAAAPADVTAAPYKRHWKYGFRLFGKYYIYFSNIRLKKRYQQMRPTVTTTKNYGDIKSKIYKRQRGICPQCGQPFDYEHMEAHHLLPVSRFPELAIKRKNIVMLCPRCHKEIHCNPFLNIRLMRATAEHFGVDLRERYHYYEDTKD